MLDITTEDRIAIHAVIALHGHVADDRRWDRLDEIFTDDVVFDITDSGYGIVHGLSAMRELIRASRDDASHPLGHHVTNIVITGRDDRTVLARSKALTVSADGTSGTATYEDALRLEQRGWRISYRKVRAPRPRP